MFMELFAFANLFNIKMVNLFGLLSLEGKERETRLLEIFSMFDFLSTNVEEEFSRIIFYPDSASKSLAPIIFEDGNTITSARIRELFLNLLFPDGVPASISTLIKLR